MSLKNLALCYNAIVSSLDDPETPVRVHAALALSEMIRHTYGKKYLPHAFIANAVYNSPRRRQGHHRQDPPK